jgi:hypothetical protein
MRLYIYCVTEHYASPCFYLKHNISETGFCLRLQVEPTELGPIDRTSPYLRTPAPTQESETELFVVTFCMCLISLITNPNSAHSHSVT